MVQFKKEKDDLLEDSSDLEEDEELKDMIDDELPPVKKTLAKKSSSMLSRSKTYVETVKN